MADASFNNVVLLVYGNGAHGGTTFVDSSPVARTLTRSGNTVTKTDVYKYGGASIYFDGSGDYLAIADSDDFYFGSGDFTIEAWIRPQTNSGTITKGIIAQRSSSTSTHSFSFWIRDDGLLGFEANNNSYTCYSVAGVVPHNAWSHVAVCRSGSTLRMFVNGTVVKEQAISITFSNYAQVIRIGQTSSSLSTTYYKGHIDDLRVTKGVARYTGAFTPPTTQLLDGTTAEAEIAVTLADASSAVTVEINPTTVYLSAPAALALETPLPNLPLQPPTASYGLTAQTFLLPIQIDVASLTLASQAAYQTAAQLESATEFRHAPLVPWVMPMTQPVYPPAASGIALTPALPDITIRGLWSPSDMIFGWTFDEGTDTISIPLTSLFELTAAQANALTGDWRAVALALCNTIWDAYIELDDPPKALQLSYAPGYVQNSGVFAGHVRTEYTATAFLNFPDKSIASEP